MKNTWGTAMVIVAIFSSIVSAQVDTEKMKIEYLISCVENLNGAKFIRNGSEHTGKEAAEHLRMKLKMAGGKVKTAEDFIRLCASKSMTTGEPYAIRFSDGKTMKSEEYFREKLKEYNSTPR